MTREEAVRTIEEIKNCYTNDRDYSYYGDEYHGLTTYENTALDMAIKALSEQKKGRVLYDERYNICVCSECGYTAHTCDYYCSNCGVEFESEEQDE